MSATQSYITNAQFLEQALPLFSALQSQTITDACNWASRQADGYLFKRYFLPLQSWDVDLTTAVLVLAQWKLLTGPTGGFRPGSGQNEVVAKQYDDTIKWLTQISQGLVALVNCVDSSGGAVDEEGSLSVSECKQDFRRAGVTGRGGFWNGGGGWWS